MKILYVLQQSIFNNDGQWLSADSNINMFVGFANAVLEQRDDIIFDVVIAPVHDFADIDSHLDIMNHPSVRFIPHNFPVDAFLNRQHFDTNEWKTLLRGGGQPYDVIINNITEQSRNIRTLLDGLGFSTKLITQCFWLDCPEIGEAKVPPEWSYDWRQFDGFECSDLATFTCNSTFDAWLENSEHKFTDEYIEKISAKSRIWDFGYSQKEIDSVVLSERDPFNQIADNVPLIVFPNRLSGINYTHHEEFIEALRLLAKHIEFRVVFTNPSGKVNIKELDVPYLVEITRPLNREEYVKLLKAADISVHLFTRERYGGCAMRESIAAGCIPVVAPVHEADRIVNYEGLKCLIDTDLKPEVYSLSRALANAYKIYKDRDLSALDRVLGDIRRKNAFSSFEKSSQIALRDIDELVKQNDYIL